MPVAEANQLFVIIYSIGSLICCSHYNVGSESQIRCRPHNAAAKANSLLTIQFRQWNLQICCRLYNFSSESQICCRTRNSVVNTNSLFAIEFRQRIANSLQNTQFGNEYQFAAHNSILAANHKFTAEHTHAFSIPVHTISSNPNKFTWF
jgi:hypothetical protein